ncbi:hypothetical protein E4U43_000810 [Claviceps pusilla]|uniref:Zn(2)-C6 fungal-type domain-containing protein n=1 Tax=Claviceps pusilla TaxID=123648 RepID=A0A9P7N8T6_9HYPO|nr:hypothetical protein E4U43_000810 [Claviceps pusilla]
MDRDSSSQTPSGPSQPSTGSTPQGTGVQSSGRQNHSTPAASSSASSRLQTGHPQNSKRRRGFGVVTPNACTECRKKRAKCDGQRPCGRCKTQQDIECVYEVPVRQSKENLRTEIENLRSRQRSSDQVFSALVRPDLWEEVLRRIREGQSVENISEWLGANTAIGTAAAPRASGSRLQQIAIGIDGVDGIATQQHGVRGDVQHNSPWSVSQPDSVQSNNSYPDAINWTPEMSVPHRSRVASWAESMPMDQMAEHGDREYWGLEQVLTHKDEPEMKTPPRTWTGITDDIHLVQHLLALYFCWEYPTFASLSKEHFLQDFRDGRHRYCSSILVNALLALGCRFSTQPMTRANPDDPYTSGDHFFKEAQRLFHQETDHHNVTTIQALGIMSIREASCGRDSESWYYAGQSIRLAVEMGLHTLQDGLDEDDLAVQSATFWGAFALDHAWSLATGSLPQCSLFPQLPPKPGIIGNVEASLWVPYTDDGAPLQRSCEQPSNVRSVYKCFCELSELVHQSLYMLHSPGKPLTARELLKIYTQYLNWYDRIPEVLRLGHNFTPAVLFAHMYYHFAILLLFRPLIKLRINGSKILPKDVCTQAADAIQGLLSSYSQLYTLRRTPSFVPYFVLTSSIMHLAVGASAAEKSGHGQITSSAIKTAVKIDPAVKEALQRGIADLTEMAPCHHFAEQALNILRYLAKKWNVDVDFAEETLLGEDYDRIVRPFTSSLNFFAPNVNVEDFVCDWGMGKFMLGNDQEEEKDQLGKTAESMENPLFWPFPMQGRPILPTGKELEKAGFALLYQDGNSGD